MTFTEQFAENAATLLLTAVLTGFLVPLIFRLIDERRGRQQKIFEADLSRQNQIIASQVKLLEDLSSLLWEYQLSLIAVPYYRQFSENRFQAALNTYEDGVGTLLAKIRAEISKSLRLTPRPIYEKLKWLYYKELLPLDLKISVLAQQEKNGNGDGKAWNELNQYAVYNLSEIVDKIIDDVAHELKLKSQMPSKQPPEAGGKEKPDNRNRIENVDQIQGTQISGRGNSFSDR